MQSTQLILKEALSIDELLQIPCDCLSENKNKSFHASSVIKKWQESSAAGDEKRFNEMLKKERLTIDKLNEIFSSDICLNESIKPRWMKEFEWIYPEFKNIDLKTTTKEIESIPFSHIYTKLALKSSAIVFHNTKKIIGHLEEKKIFELLGTGLIEQLSDLTHKVLYKEFNNYRTSLILDDKKNASPHTSYMYDHFIDKLRKGGIDIIFRKYPVMARLISLTVYQWIESNTLLLKRLLNDIKEIEDVFHENKILGIPVEISGGLSDPHDSGQTVQIIKFKNGLKCLYKPKKCELDLKWHNLVNDLNDLSPPIHLKASRIIDKGQYGWSEYINNLECTTQAEVNSYYHRAGALTALLFLLSATDMHYENIIAYGDYPVPIDLEMILQEPENKNKKKSKNIHASQIANELCQRSVLSVGILPLYDSTVDNKILAVGGMNFMNGNIYKEDYTNINSDEMRPFSKSFNSIPKNIPILNGKITSFSDHLRSFTIGFESYSIFLLGIREKYGPNYFLKYFKSLISRNVVKPTRFYYALRKRLLNPDSWTNGLIWSAQADFVSRFNDLNRSDESISKTERASLVDLNIPIFYYKSNAGYNEAKKRILEYSLKEVAQQIQIIKTCSISLEKYYFNKQLKKTQNFNLVLHSNTTESLKEEVDRISKKVFELAIRSNGSASWIGLDWFGGADVARLVPLGFDLYNGNIGISLYLAAYSKYSNLKEYQALAEDALSELIEYIHDRNGDRFARTLGIGACTGIGSVVYGLTAFSKITNNKKYCNFAVVAASLMTEQLINSDKKLDVIGGTAGAIISLLYLYKSTGISTILDKAVFCGNRLLNLKRVIVNGKKCWVGAGFDEIPSGGFSHGAAGFAYAYSMLFHYTKNIKYSKAVSDSLSYMNDTYFDGDWIDNILDTNGKIVRRRPIFRSSQWCHGGIGIGLSRLGSRNNLGEDLKKINSDLLRAIEASKLFGNKFMDSLCCGAMGEVEFLSQVGSYFNNPQILQSAKDCLLKTIYRSKLNRGYQFGGGPDDYHLGLFRGITGVGYTILRQFDPTLPNVSILSD